MKTIFAKNIALLLLSAAMPAAALAQYENDSLGVVTATTAAEHAETAAESENSAVELQKTVAELQKTVAALQQTTAAANAAMAGMHHADSASLKPFQQKYQEKMQTKRHIQRIDRDISKTVFVPKGIWMTGATVNFRSWENENQNLLVIKDLDIDGHTFSVSPAVGYFIANNVAIGGRYSYSRNYFFLGNLDLNLGEDFNIALDDLYYLQHRHTGIFFVRTYMSLLGSKIMGFFSEVQAAYSQSNGKNSTGRRDEANGINTFDGTYEKVHTLRLGFTPGVCAFISDYAAIEASIGVLGVDYNWSHYKNVKPGLTEYEYGKSKNGGANFRFNLFSINIGMTLYL